MTQQDTITIPRELGEWLDNAALSPRDSTGTGQERYTPKAAHGLLRGALDAKPGPMPEPTTSTAWSRAQAKRITQLTKESEAALDDVARLRQELTAEKARYSEVLATIEDNKELAETRTAALTSRIQALRAERTELEADLRTSREANEALTTENSHTRHLLREATEHIESMTAAGIEADADKLGADLAARSANAARVPELDVWIDRTTFTPATNEVVIRVVIEQPPLTPATTPKQNEGF